MRILVMAVTVVLQAAQHDVKASERTSCGQSEPTADAAISKRRHTMSLARIVRKVGLQICRLPGMSLPIDPEHLADRVDRAPRRNRVRGAASEPHCTAAGFISAGDGTAESFAVR